MDDAHVVNKHCAKGPLDCARMAQFVFKGTKVVTSKHQVDRLKVSFDFFSEKKK